MPPPRRSCSAARDTAPYRKQLRERPSGSRDNEDARPGVASDTMSASVWVRVQRQRCHCCGGIVVSAPFATRAAAFTPMAFVPVLLRHPGGACAPTPQSEHILEVPESP